MTAARRRSGSDFIVQEYGSDRVSARVSRWNGVIPDRKRGVLSKSLDEAPDGFSLRGSGSLSAESGVEGIAQVELGHAAPADTKLGVAVVDAPLLEDHSLGIADDGLGRAGEGKDFFLHLVCWRRRRHREIVYAFAQSVKKSVSRLHRALDTGGLR
jgi:hypothetical protein